ncbi:Protein of unknown function DUF3645 [Penicillium expansum]|nr:Protein of unknown function DUF3645 [Penicillium expansum]
MSPCQAMDVDHDLSAFIFHHIFFPLKLPQEAENNLVELENCMVVVARDVLQDFIQNVSPESQQPWALALSMLNSWILLHAEQGISKFGLENALSNVKITGAIACHIRAQNCGWVAFYDEDKDRLLVDAFEVSPQAKPSLSSSGGLLRRFPGVSVAISADKLADPRFRSYLATTISKLASEEVSQMRPKGIKGGSQVDETRETIHPGLVTEGLMAQLLALGTQNEETKLMKCVRDEVNWMSALLPWRRSPAWLGLRVALQLVLRRCFPEAEHRLQYKNFILYLMAKLAANEDLVVHSDEAVDCWKISHARIGRRIHKLNDDVFPFVANQVNSTSKYLLGKLMTIQEHIKKSNRMTIPLIPPSASQDDLHLSLVHCKDYFQIAMCSRFDEAQPTDFCPTHTPSLDWINGFPIPKFNSIKSLTEFEQWVDEHLASWFINQPASRDVEVCRGLENTISEYLNLARPKYASNPQATSIMLLVVLELWVVLDKAALRLCPLLREFSPEIPESFLEPLLLPKLSQMKRAKDIEQHIHLRHKGAVKTNPSIFCDPAQNCFGVQYFESSEEHQILEQQIEDHAARGRVLKRVEWEMLSDKYKTLCGRGEQLAHYYGYNFNHQTVHLNHQCEKCSVEKQAGSVSIKVHEWPLPTNLVEKRVAVFELNLPIWFTSWRNTTWKLLHNVGRRDTVICDSKELEWLQYEDIHAFANQVMATQRDCDKMLSLHEFEAFGCLRSGEHLQWCNIVRNLASSALSLNEEAVVSLIKQAAWELGTPSGSVRRVTHQAFEDIGFGDCLLDLLHERLTTIKTNWNEHCTFDLIVTLGLRVLALSNGSPSVEKVVEFLRQCRQVAMDWCDKLNGGFLRGQGNEDGGKQGLILRIASACQATYDVDPVLLNMILETPQDLFCFIRCSILLFENSPSKTHSLPCETKLCLENAEKIRFLSRSRIIRTIMKCPSGLNEAIQNSISCLEFSGTWSICEGGGSWVTTATSNSIEGFEQRTHFNYVTGELLVDGNPPGRLPASFTGNALYQRLFGTRIIPVTPSSLPGASFVLSHTIEGSEVHFGMQSGRLFIKTRKGCQILQLIPQDILENDFPRVFVSDNFHWLNLETGVLEFRPLSQPWKPCHRNWHLSFDPCAPDKMLMEQDSKSLVDIRSSLFIELVRILKVLDVEEEIFVIQTAVGTLEAELSRLRLKFFVKADGRVASKEFSALIDLDQDVGCFYGLNKNLALIDSSNNTSVIVPYGYPVVTRKDHHVAVDINLPTGNRVKYMHYCLDKHLQILRGSCPLAILYQAYLHAITSFPLPDELTRRSGTEEAIRILRQESLRSSFPLHNDCIETLERIAGLTPCRTFYPRHLRVMQTVLWSSNLGQLAQHDDFQPLSQEILQSSEKCSYFHDAELRKNYIFYQGSTDLLTRARCRNEQLRSSDFSGPPTSCIKKNYESRDCDISSFRSSHVDTYSLISLFSILAFEGKIHHSILLQLLQVAFSGKCKNVAVPPDWVKSLNLSLGEDLVHAQVENAIRNSYRIFTQTHNPYLTRAQRTENYRRAEIEREEKKNSDIRLCGSHVKSQWPCRNPQLPSQDLIPRVLRTAADEKCKTLCGNWFQNRNFLRFLRQVESQVPSSNSGNNNTVPVPTPYVHPRSIKYIPFRQLSLFDLIQRSRPNPTQTPLDPMTYHGPPLILQPTPELWSLANYFQASSNRCQQEYGNGLSHSIQALDDFSGSVPPTGNSDLSESFDWPTQTNAVLSHQIKLQKQKDSQWNEIVATLTIDGEKFPARTDTVRPSITVWSILSILASYQWKNVPAEWRELLVAFGKSISALRRCERLSSCIEKHDIDGFLREAESPGYEGWDPLIYPTWLLLEIENNITIRKRQVEVAVRMIKPDDGENSVLQLNMGEGKTSVITPMVAAILANGNNLLRIIVLKPLLRQIDALLSQRLGGLIKRRVYHIPFSRQTQLSSSTVSQLQFIYQQCWRNRGILIALPEQILSFRLIGLDAAERNPKMFAPLISLENWLQKKCRDVIDESDEVMDTKFQLVYTMGTQQSLDGLSGRWETTQNVLRLVSTEARRLHMDDPRCIEIDQSGYRYPILQFLKPNAIDRLLKYTLKSISENGIPGFPFTQWTLRVKKSVLRFIEHSELTKEDDSIIQKEFDVSIFITKLLVLRGLFAHHILRFSLAEKRWLVEYGLHPFRCLMAVPYRAKGVPSERAEFGHPDVAVTLTCLSYYYEGLTKEQLRDCFALLAKLHDPSTEFQNWVAPCIDALPAGLRTCSGVNLEDDNTFSQILFPLLRYQKAILDFYLSHFVFSREAKEFPRKLSSSAWDIPARRGLQLTTGFSGTNDNRFLLPLSVHQRDLGELLHTNAMVLRLLLREDNRQCILAQDEEGRQLDVDQLLKLVIGTGEVSSKPVRVLIDVGAQILEAENQSVAQKWLDMTREGDVEGAIFFNNGDEIMVIDRAGHVETLLSSSFRQRMGACLVFLDQHHSRGVDLKLPPATRAAVTLGPRLTKDKLVQACNRLRGLEKCQSLLFLIPPEVSHNMRFSLGISSDRDFTSADVLKWSMVQTCQTLDNLRPLWANQGIQYHRRISLWDLLVEQRNPSKETANSMQEPEAQTLSQLYAPWNENKATTDGHNVAEWDVNNAQIRQLLETLQSTANHVVTSTYLHEEQEREIACEVELEQQVFRPPSYTPNSHKLHDDIQYFANFGKFPGNQSSKAVTLAFQGLVNTSAGKLYHPNPLGPGLYSTLDFNQTVKISQNDLMDDFCKQVNWILSSLHSDVLIIVSQWEANGLINIIRKSENTRLNLYAPRVTKPMRSFRHLDFFGIGANIPTRPNTTMTRCLEMFSGSLYFSSFEEYKDFRAFLGLLTDDLGEIPDGGMSNEGFVKFFTRLQLQWPTDSPFVQNPLPFLSALFHIRTKGNGYQQSHVGTIIKAMPLSAERF